MSTPAAPAWPARLRAFLPGLHRFHPRLVDDLRGYDGKRFAKVRRYWKEKRD